MLKMKILGTLYLKLNVSRYSHAGDKGESIYSFYSFLTSALNSVSGQRHAPAAHRPRTHWKGGLVGHRAGLDTEVGGKILCLCRGSNPSGQSVVRATPAPCLEYVCYLKIPTWQLRRFWCHRNLRAIKRKNSEISCTAGRSGVGYCTECVTQ
jgi:hypothetical protein